MLGFSSRAGSKTRRGARGSGVYAAYIASQVASQEERKRSLEQRGLAVITTSGALVSLLFGLAAILTGAADYALPDASKPWIIGALAAFVLAGISAILTNVPLRYRGPTADALKGVIEDRWDDAPATAEREVALTQVKVIRRAKRLNRLKGRALAIAISVEILGALSLAVAVAIILCQ